MTTSTLQDRIDRAAIKLAALKARQQSAEAREKARRNNEARATRNRALVLLGVALERATRDSPDWVNKIRALLERHLTRESEREAALTFLSTLKPVAPTQNATASNKNVANQQ